MFCIDDTYMYVVYVFNGLTGKICYIKVTMRLIIIETTLLQSGSYIYTYFIIETP